MQLRFLSLQGRSRVVAAPRFACHYDAVAPRGTNLHTYNVSFIGQLYAGPGAGHIQNTKGK